MLVQSISDLRDVVPIMRRHVVAELVRQAIIQPESPVVGLLTRKREKPRPSGRGGCQGRA